MRRALILSALFAFASLAPGAPAAAGEGHDHGGKAKAQAPPGMDPAAMEAMKKAMTPGEKHKRLEFLIGSWTTENTMWMGPGEPLKTQGEARFAWAFGGRYVESTYAGKFMDEPFEGRGIDGYDNLAGRYFNVWFDNHGTGYMASHGQWSKDGKSLSLSGDSQDPATGKPVKHRMVLIPHDRSSFTMEMYMTSEGQKESKVMEILYKRAGS